MTIYCNDLEFDYLCNEYDDDEEDDEIKNNNYLIKYISQNEYISMIESIIIVYKNKYDSELLIESNFKHNIKKNVKYGHIFNKIIDKKS